MLLSIAKQLCVFSGEGATGDRAAVMVRLQDKLMSVDLFSAELRLIGASQSSRQISARQSANDAGAVPTEDLEGFVNHECCACDWLDGIKASSSTSLSVVNMFS